MLEQEKQNAHLRKHISLLEGGDAASASVVGSHSSGGGGSTVDDVRPILRVMRSQLKFRPHSSPSKTALQASSAESTAGRPTRSPRPRNSPLHHLSARTSR